MHKNIQRIVAAAILASTLCLTLGCAAAPAHPDDVADDGLQRVETALLDELYVAPNVSLANYQRVMLDPIEVNFKDGWRMQHPDLGDKEFELLRTRLAALLQEMLVAELARGGYMLAEAPAPNVIRLRASIVNHQPVTLAKHHGLHRRPDDPARAGVRFAERRSGRTRQGL